MGGKQIFLFIGEFFNFLVICHYFYFIDVQWRLVVEPVILLLFLLLTTEQRGCTT